MKNKILMAQDFIEIFRAMGIEIEGTDIYKIKMNATAGEILNVKVYRHTRGSQGKIQSILDRYELVKKEA